MVYDKIIIIGQATIALGVVKNLLEYSPSIQVLAYRPRLICMLKTFCMAKGLPYEAFEESAKLTSFLSVIKCKTLIISANNNYIFPQEILHKDNFTIINFHNALLPSYKGVNAPIWSIYNQDSFSGITWHLVTSELDSGEIIIQKKIPLADNITSLELIKTLMKLGLQAFLEIKQNLLEQNLQTKPMPTSKHKPKKSNELPNNGFLDFEWETQKISAFLRSMDTGGILQRAKISLAHTDYIITQYSLNQPLSNHQSILINKDNIYLLLSKNSNGGGGRL